MREVLLVVFSDTFATEFSRKAKSFGRQDYYKDQMEFILEVKVLRFECEAYLG